MRAEPLHAAVSRQSRYLNCDPCVVLASALLPVLWLYLAVQLKAAP